MTPSPGSASGREPPERPARPYSFRRVTLRGLVVLLPSVLTLWMLWYAFIFVFNNVAEPINGGVRAGIIYLVPRTIPEARLPEWYVVSKEQLAQYKASMAGQSGALNDETALRKLRARNLEQVWQSRWYLQGAGLLVAVALIYLAGTLVGGFLGRRAYSYFERLISRIPGFKQVYPHVKQVVDLLLGEKKMAFNRVVLVAFPRPGSYVIAFVTAEGMKTSTASLGGPTLTVFVPNTPTPFTGFTLNVRSDEVIDLPISIDEALRFVITGGVLLPTSQAGGAAGAIDVLPGPAGVGLPGETAQSK